MEATTIKSRRRPRNTYPENIFVVSSKDAQVPEGKVYPVIKGKDRLFIVNKNGKKVPLDDNKYKWEERGRAVMIVKATSSALDTIELGNVYRVYLDAENDELFIIDEHNEKVLLDKNIFKWEVL